MTDSLYRKVQKKLDTFSMGFPETESGIEIKILKKLFSPERAELFLEIGPLLETPEAVAERMGRPVGEVAEKMEDMACDGLLFRLKKGASAKYAAIPFVHGLFEFKIKRMDREFAELVNEYFHGSFDKSMMNIEGLFLRTIPIGESLTPENRVATYDDAVEILKSRDKIVVADCICRKLAETLHQDCGKPQEVCFMFGSMAQYYIDNNMGRSVDLDEAVAILKKAQNAGLVTQPATTQNPAGMCNCCSDCCGVLRAAKKHPRPADIVYSNHFAEVDAGACTGCGVCEERCPMEAITVNEGGIAEVRLERCIGCGLCVPSCPTEAVRMMSKSPESHRVPPQSSFDQMITMAKKRGIIG